MDRANDADAQTVGGPTGANRKKTALVTGGSGFIGGHLLDALHRSEDYQSLYSLDIEAPAHARAGVTHRAHDVRAPIDLDFDESIDEIYNLAAVHRTPGHDEHEYYETNLRGALHSCELAERVGARTIVFTSSIAVYGPTEDEKTEASPLTPTSSYGRSKLMAEKIHRDWRARDPERRRLIVVRPAVIFGPGEGGNMSRLAKFQSTGFFFFPGRRDTKKACGYVDELVRSLRFAVASGEPELTYNFCYPKCYTVEEITDAYTEHAGLPKVRGAIPRSVAMLGAAAFESLGFFGIKTPINRARMRKMLESTNIAPTRLIELGYAYETDFAAAVTRWRGASASGRLE